MSSPEIIAESPLSRWWRCNIFLINEHCMALSGSVSKATRLRRLLAEASEGRLSIDDRRLRCLVGRLIKDDARTLNMIRKHRQWAKAKGGVR